MTLVTLKFFTFLIFGDGSALSKINLRTIQKELEEVAMEDEIELIQSIKDETTGTELVLSGAQGDERYDECLYLIRE